MHTWDYIRECPVCYEAKGAKLHESIFRSYQILTEIKRMMEMGDSQETVAKFINWAEQDGR